MQWQKLMDCVINMQPENNYKTIIDPDVMVGCYHSN